MVSARFQIKLYSTARISPIQWKNSVFEYAVFECKKIDKIKQAFFFKGLSEQLLVVLIADLDGRLLTPFSLWLGSAVARPTCSCATLNLDLVSQDLLYFSQNRFFVLSEQWRTFRRIGVESSNFFNKRVTF